MHLEFREKSGFVCKHLGGSTAVGNGKTEIWDLEIDDGDSELKLPHFTMGYKNSREFKYFLEKVSLHAELDGTRISSRTLSHFAPVLGKTDIELVLDGELSGPVADLRFDNLAVATADKSSSLLLDGRIKGLPDIRKSLFDLRIRQCRSSVTGIDRLLSKVDMKKEVGLGKTQVMEQVARECGVALVAYTITHHTRQSAVGLPFIRQRNYGGKDVSVTEYTMSEIIASIYAKMEATGLAEGILFIDEINCVSETLTFFTRNWLRMVSHT